MKLNEQRTLWVLLKADRSNIQNCQVSHIPSLSPICSQISKNKHKVCHYGRHVVTGFQRMSDTRCDNDKGSIVWQKSGNDEDIEYHWDIRMTRVQWMTLTWEWLHVRWYGCCINEVLMDCTYSPHLCSLLILLITFAPSQHGHRVRLIGDCLNQ